MLPIFALLSSFVPVLGGPSMYICATIYTYWTYLVLNYTPLRIELVGFFTIRLLLYLLPSLVALSFDTLTPDLAAPRKLEPSALPPPDLDRHIRTLRLVFLNLAISTAIQAALSTSIAAVFSAPIFHTSVVIPFPWTVGKNLALLIAARELLAYLIHRHVLHNRTNPIARRIARQHATHGAHALRGRTAPYALLLCADHPAPFILHRLAPLYLPALVLRPHLLIWLLFAALVTLEETFSMSGYVFDPAALPVSFLARRAARHYTGRRGTGDFAPLGVMDRVCGTSVAGRAAGSPATVRAGAVGRRVTTRSAGGGGRSSAWRRLKA